MKKKKKKEKKEKAIVEDTVHELYGQLYTKWVLKLDEKYNELSNGKKNEFCSTF